MGWVGTDPRITTFEDGRQIMKVQVATDEAYKDRNEEWRQEVTWHTIVALSGEEMPRFTDIKKGQMIRVLGKIKNKYFETRDRQIRQMAEISATELSII